MMIAKGTAEDGSEILLLGLSKGNIERLTAGMPVNLTRASHGNGIPAGLTIVMLYGETEQDIVNQLQQAGVVDKDTKVNVEPRLA